MTKRLIAISAFALCSAWGVTKNIPGDYAATGVGLQQALTDLPTFGCGTILNVAGTTTYTNDFTLPASNCSGNPLIVQYTGTLPARGIRMTPNYIDGATSLPHLIASSGKLLVALSSDSGPSKGWTFKGIYFDVSNTGSATRVGVELGTQDFGIATSAGLPDTITLDHCIIRGSRIGSTRVGLQLNGQNLTIIDSWISSVWNSGASDGQGIVALSGDGPLAVKNTYVEGQTETIGIGGSGSIVASPAAENRSSYLRFLTSGSIPGNIDVTDSHLTHGLWTRYDGLLPFIRANSTLVRLGQVWLVYSDSSPTSAGGVGTRIGVYQAQQSALTGGSFPSSFCTTPDACTFTDGSVTWKLISCNNGCGETFIGAGIAKNLIECKQCGRLNLERNYLENAWTGGGGGGAQGYAMTWTNRRDVAPYSAGAMGPITVKDNIIYNTASFANIKAVGDDADQNWYAQTVATNAGPYTIPAGGTIVVDGVSIVLNGGGSPASMTAAQVSDAIYTALPSTKIALTAFTGTTADVGNYVQFSFNLSGTPNYYYQSNSNAPFPLSLHGFTSGDAALNNQICQAYLTGGPSFTCRLPYGASTPGMSGSPTVAGSGVSPGVFTSPVDSSTYLFLAKSPAASGAGSVTTITLGDASTGVLAVLGLPTTTYYCTHPITHTFYGCGSTPGINIVNNLGIHISQDDNYLTGANSPRIVFMGGGAQMNFERNTIDHKNGPFFSGAFWPNYSSTIKNNVDYWPNPDGSQFAQFSDGTVTAFAWANYYLQSAPLTSGATIFGYDAVTAGAHLPANDTTTPGFWSGNVLPGAWVIESSAESKTCTVGTCGGNFAHTTYKYDQALVTFGKDWRLANAGEPGPVVSNWNIYGAFTADGSVNDSSVELGIKFVSDVAGQVAGVRYYKRAGCSAPTTGSLWTSTGSLLATASFGAATDNAWNSLSFASAITISASTQYVVSFHTTCIPTFSGAGATFDHTPLHSQGSVFTYGGSTVFPTSAGGNNWGSDVTFNATGALTVDTNCANGSTPKGSRCLPAFGDYAPTGVDTAKLPLIRNLKVQYSNTAAVFSWTDSVTSQAMPGVIRICTEDPQFNPNCTPRGTTVGIDGVSGALSDNSDNDTSPKNGLQRYIVVTSLSAATKYYFELYRGGHWKAGSFTTLASVTGSVTLATSRDAKSSMGAVAKLSTQYGTTYARATDIIGGGGLCVQSCTAGTICTGTFTVAAGLPQYVRPRITDSGDNPLWSGPVDVTVPGGSVLIVQ